jgi:hypothetical protein
MDRQTYRYDKAIRLIFPVYRCELRKVAVIRSNLERITDYFKDNPGASMSLWTNGGIRATYVTTLIIRSSFTYSPCLDRILIVTSAVETVSLYNPGTYELNDLYNSICRSTCSIIFLRLGAAAQVELWPPEESAPILRCDG